MIFEVNEDVFFLSIVLGKMSLNITKTLSLFIEASNVDS